MILNRLVLAMSWFASVMLLRYVLRDSFGVTITNFSELRATFSELRATSSTCIFYLELVPRFERSTKPLSRFKLVHNNSTSLSLLKHETMNLNLSICSQGFTIVNV